MVGWLRPARSEYVSYPHFPQLFVLTSRVLRLRSIRLDNGEEMSRGSRPDAHRKSNKVTATYNPIADACVMLHTHRGLTNALGVLVVDVVLLLTMLIGLLLHAHRHSTGIWKLLYQQVIS
jgi:hypothetical protein